MQCKAIHHLFLFELNRLYHHRYHFISIDFSYFISVYFIKWFINRQSAVRMYCYYFSFFITQIDIKSWYNLVHKISFITTYHSIILFCIDCTLCDILTEYLNIETCLNKWSSTKSRVLVLQILDGYLCNLQ